MPHPVTIKIGDTFSSNSHGIMTVIDYKSSALVTVIFNNTGFITTTSGQNIRNGQVKDKLVPSIFGVGFLGGDKYITGSAKKPEKAYKAWFQMLRRCYDKEALERCPTYKGIKVCNDWHNYQNFAAWFYKQDWKNKQLDKDILIPGNKVYSPRICCMVDSEINQLLNKSAASRGAFPLGVTKSGNLFSARCNIDGKNVDIGRYKTPDEAANAYNFYKSSHLRNVAKTQPEPIRSGLIRHADKYWQMKQE